MNQKVAEQTYMPMLQGQELTKQAGVILVLLPS